MRIDAITPKKMTKIMIDIPFGIAREPGTTSRLLRASVAQTNAVRTRRGLHLIYRPDS